MNAVIVCVTSDHIDTLKQWVTDEETLFPVVSDPEFSMCNNLTGRLSGKCLRGVVVFDTSKNPVLQMMGEELTPAQQIEESIFVLQVLNKETN